MSARSHGAVQLGRRLSERIEFRGHPAVLALHPTTIEVTADEHLTRRGDCIVGVGSRVGCAGLGSALRKGLATDGAKVTFSFVVGGDIFVVDARGDSRLTLTNQHDMVIRKSDFISDRTVAVGANAAAKDMPRAMVGALRSEETRAYVQIEVS